MTAQQTQPGPEPVQAEPQPLTVSAEPGSRLEQLQSVYPALKAAADEAAKQLKAVTDAIKLELTALNAEERRFELAAAGDCPPLRLTWTVRQSLDSKRLKAELPETYAAFVKPSGSWALRPGGGA